MWLGNRKAPMACVFLALCLCYAHADFSGDYAPTKWTAEAYDGDGYADWYSPEELDLYSGINGSGSFARFDATVRVPRSGNFRFQWGFGVGNDAVSSFSGYKFLWLSNGVARVLAADTSYADGTESFSVQANDVVGFRVVAPKGENSINFSYVYLTYFYGPGQAPKVPTIVTQPESLSAYLGGSAELYVEVAEPYDPDLVYQWQHNGQDLEDETGESLYLEKLTADKAGTYRVVVKNLGGSILSEEAVLTVVEGPLPVIVTEPENVSVCLGDWAWAEFYVEVEDPYDPDLEYQWQHNGQDLEDETGESLYLENLTADKAGTYRVVVKNVSGSITSRDAILTVLVPAEINTQPPPQTAVCRGQPVNFCVTASGTAPLNYQWKLNGVDLVGATTPCLTIPNARIGDSGTYWVLVWNDCGEVYSEDAELIVWESAEILGQPSAQTRFPGETATFSVAAQGTAPLSYQWRYSGADVLGATQANLIVPSVGPGSTGGYSVVVSNACGGVVSALARLDVAAAPPRLGMSVRSNGVIAIELQAPSGRICVLEVATNMASRPIEWQRIATNSLCGDRLLWSDTKAGPTRFYRALALPELAQTPMAPTGLLVEMTLSVGVVNLSWSDNSSDETQFIVERGVDDGAFQILQLLPANQRRLTDSTAGADACFTYRVRAANCAGESLPSNQASLCRLLAPANLIALPGANGRWISLVWTDKSTHEIGFVVERSLNGGSFVVIHTNGSNGAAFEDRTVFPANCYSYRVKALGNAGSSDYSSPAAVCTPTTPVAPSSLTGTWNISQESVVLNWIDNSTNELGFLIERAESDGDFEVVGGVAANQKTFEDSELIAGACYLYRVVASNAVGFSAYASSEEVCVPEVPLPAPGPLMLSRTSKGSVRVEWADNSSDETGFEVERSTNEIHFVIIATAPANADASTRIVDGNVKDGQSYWYRVRAVKAGLRSRYSPVGFIAVVVPPVRPGPLVLSMTSGGSVRVEWADNSSNETGFGVERAIGVGGFGVITNAPANSDAAARIVDTRVAGGQTYNYRVRAFRGTTASAYSDEVSIVVVARPNAPGPLSLTMTSEGSVRVEWADNSNNETGFEVERATGAGSFSVISTAPANPDIAARIVDSAVVDGQTYRYRGGLRSLTSDAVGPVAVPYVEAPNPVSVTVTGEGSVRVEWGDNSSTETGFVVQRRREPDAGLGWVEVTRVGANPDMAARIVDTEPRSGRSYCYRVAALRGAEQSTWSSEGCITMSPASPTLTSPIPNATGVSKTPTFTWAGVEGAERYVFEIAADAAAEGNIVVRRTAVLPASATSHAIPANDPLSASRIFYWRIRAENQKAPGVWQSSNFNWRRFTTRS
jgi:hypothetical protein